MCLSTDTPQQLLVHLNHARKQQAGMNSAAQRQKRRNNINSKPEKRQVHGVDTRHDNVVGNVTQPTPQTDRISHTVISHLLVYIIFFFIRLPQCAIFLPSPFILKQRCFICVFFFTSLAAAATLPLS